MLLLFFFFFDNKNLIIFERIQSSKQEFIPSKTVNDIFLLLLMKRIFSLRLVGAS